MDLPLHPRACAALLVLAFVPCAAHAIDIYVGQGPDCTSGSLSAAIATAAASGPGPHTIWLTSEIVHDNQSLLVSDLDLTIRGVHACDMPDDEPVTINGNGAGSVLRIFASSNREVTLKNLVVRGGYGTNGFGGGLYVAGRVNVTLDNTVVRQNAAANGGGGVYVENAITASGGIVNLLPGARIDNNTASQGGGVLAVGARVRMHVSGTQIASNVATSGGGGVALINARLETLKLVDQPDGTADGAKIVANAAGASGGGIHANGEHASVVANELIVDGNTAVDAGAGIFASNGAYVGLQRDYADAPSTLNCPTWRQCSRLSNNIVAQGAPGTYGAALALVSGARAYVAQTIVRGNVSADAPGAHVRGASLQLEGVLFTQNHSYAAPGNGTAMIRTAYQPPEAIPTLRVAYTTFGGNTTTATNGQIVPSVDAVAQQNTALSLYAVAFFDSPYSPTAYGPYVDDCVVRGTGGGAGDPYGTHTRTAAVPSAGFNDAGVYDFRLRTHSALTDFCDASVYAPAFRDIVLTLRCTDTPGKPDVHGRCDVGAYESDHIFGNSFQ